MKPLCDECGTHHEKFQAHRFLREREVPLPNVVRGEVIARSVKRELEKKIQSLADDTKPCPACGGTGHVPKDRAAYMRAYRKRKAV